MQTKEEEKTKRKEVVEEERGLFAAADMSENTCRCYFGKGCVHG